jgi:phosphoglycerate dehydrogenase-like enzyme
VVQLVAVLLSAHIDDAWQSRLAKAFPDVHFVSMPKSGEVPPDGADAIALFRCTMSKPELQRTISGAPSLRWIHSCTAGFDQLLIPEITERGLTVTRSAASHHIPIAEWVLAYIFLMTKRFPELLRAQAEHRWDRLEMEELGGKTVGIVGAGAIGTEVATRCRPLGMRVIATKRTPAPLPAYDEVLGAEDLPRLLAESDYVVLACPLTSETRGMIGERELRIMKQTAFLLNIARGGLIVDDDLIQALREGWIAGACLDAFATEPLPPESPLWSIDRLVVTPHASSSSPLAMKRAEQEFVVNLRRFLNDEPLNNKIREPALGY